MSSELPLTTNLLDACHPSPCAQPIISISNIQNKAKIFRWRPLGCHLSPVNQGLRKGEKCKTVNSLSQCHAATTFAAVETNLKTK